MYQEVWQRYDPQGTGVFPIHRLRAFLHDLQPPLQVPFTERFVGLIIREQVGVSRHAHHTRRVTRPDLRLASSPVAGPGRTRVPELRRLAADQPFQRAALRALPASHGHPVSALLPAGATRHLAGARAAGSGRVRRLRPFARIRDAPAAEEGPRARRCVRERARPPARPRSLSFQSVAAWWVPWLQFRKHRAAARACTLGDPFTADERQRAGLQPAERRHCQCSGWRHYL